MKKVIVTVILLAAAGLGWFLLRGNSDDYAVRGVIDDFCQKLSRSANENPMTAAYRLSTITGECAVPLAVTVKTSESFNGSFGAQEVVSHAARFQQFFKSVKVGMQDLKVEFPTPDAAVAVGTGSLVGTPRSGGEEIAEYRDVTMRLQKADGKWRIAALEISSVIVK